MKADHLKASLHDEEVALGSDDHTGMLSYTFAVVSHMPSPALSHGLAKYMHMDHTPMQPVIPPIPMADAKFAECTASDYSSPSPPPTALTERPA